MDLNYREENVDRFLEIIATAQKFKLNFSFSLLNAPEQYKYFTGALNIMWLYQKSPEADLQIECSKCLSLPNVFKKPEPLATIEGRIGNCNFVKTEKLDSVCESLLKNAAEKLNFTTDNVINVIRLAEVIASMESSMVKAQHIAEACQYVKRQQI
jgi:hypothetical protein